jgi:hypothetical protein
MLELLFSATAIAVLTWLVRPFFRGRPLPAWLERARLRGRPGVPVTAWLLAVVLMGVTWLIGDQRGIGAFILWLIWIGAPLAASWLTWLWIRRKPAAANGRIATRP